MHLKPLFLSLLLGCLPAVAMGQSYDGEYLKLMGRVSDEEVARISAEAAAHPLGSEQNPVRAEGVRGQHAYLRRLRCADGAPPTFSRFGNLGPGIYGSIIDGYRVVCEGSEPADSTVVIDLYHPGYREAGAPQGFTIVD